MADNDNGKDSKVMRRRLNQILDICKFRKDKNAIECFDNDCKDIQEVKIVSSKTRRRGDGTIQKTEVDTGNIMISCVTHKWKGMFSVSQLDNLKMPARTTTVNEGTPKVDDPEGQVVER